MLGVADMRIIKIAFLGLFFFCLVSCAQQKKPTAETMASFNAHVRQGAYYLNQGSYEKALEEFDKTLALESEFEKVRDAPEIREFLKE